MQTIGPSLQEARREAGQYRFAHNGGAGALNQGLFVAGLALVLWHLVNPVVAIVFAGVPAIVLVLGGLVNGLLETELELNAERSTFSVRRGLRGLARRTAGKLECFAAVVRDHDGHGSWQVCLQPRGSERGYCVYTFAGDESAAARHTAEELGRALGLPVEHREAAPSEGSAVAECDVERPPVGSSIRVATTADGALITIPVWGPWTEIVRLHPGSVEFLMRLRLPFGRSSDGTTRALWKEISEIEIEPLRTGSRGVTVRWRLRRDWREQARAHWRWLCAERLRPPSLPPFGWSLWFLVSEFPFVTTKAVTIRFWGREALQVGGDQKISAEDLAWLRSVLRSAWQKGSQGLGAARS